SPWCTAPKPVISRSRLWRWAARSSAAASRRGCFRCCAPVDSSRPSATRAGWGRWWKRFRSQSCSTIVRRCGARRRSRWHWSRTLVSPSRRFVVTLETLSPAERGALEARAVNTIRFLAADAVEKARSGHPGMPMGMAEVAYVLWTKFLRFDPERPDWPDRDRFVLSAGHGSMLLYSLLHLAGYDLPLDELKRFRQWGSRTPGHPEVHLTPGVELTTGPLGQGIATAVGIAAGLKMAAARFNAHGPIVTGRVFGIASDGDLMEGISGEASSLAGHLGLDNLVFFYDDNHITIDGKTELDFSEDVGKRYEAYGWFVQHIDGHDHAQIRTALDRAVAEPARPSLIIARTHIGIG